MLVEPNNIYHGDCMELMKQIPDKSVDCIICDLPYGSTKCAWDVIIPFDKLWIQYQRIIKTKSNIILFGTGLFAFKLALSNENFFRYDLVWKKSKCGSPLTAKYMPMKKHELLLVFGEPASKYNPQMTEGVPYKRKWTEHKSNNLEFGIKGVQYENKGTRHPASILDFAQKWRRQDQVHPTQKPLSLLEWLVKTYSNENDLVLDNCMGSGTTCLAARNLSRQYIGIEKEEKYFKIAQERLEKNGFDREKGN